MRQANEEPDALLAQLAHIHITTINTCTLRKRYKSCHWGCTFSKGTLLYLKGAYWYLNSSY